MNKVLGFSLTTLAILLSFAACSGSLPQDYIAKGEVVVHLPAADSRLINSQASLTISKYTLVFSGIGNPITMDGIPGQTLSPISLAQGTWSLTVEAFNQDQLKIGRGVVPVVITNGGSTSVNPTINPLTGNGTVKIEAPLQDLGLAVPSVSATLQQGDMLIPLTFSYQSEQIPATPTFVGYSSINNTIPGGTWVLTTVVKDGATIKSKGFETLNVVEGAITYAGMSFLKETNGTIRTNVKATAPTVSGGSGGSGTLVTSTPTITLAPVSGPYLVGGSVTVTIGSEVGATLYYTLDGTTPTVTSTVYTSPIAVPSSAVGSKTIKAVAKATGKDLSTVASNSFSVTEPMPVNSKFATNPNGQVGKYSTGMNVVNTQMKSDGFTDWTADMLIAQGVANDVAQSFMGSHEAPLYDTYALYAAWDDTNLYLGWQFVNVVDVTDPAQGYPISDNGKPWNGDIPQMILFDTDAALSSDGTLDVTGGVWAATGKIFNTFTNGMDKQLMFSSKPGVGQPAVFAAKADGKMSYGAEYVQLFKDAGVVYGYIDGLHPSITKVWGVNKPGAWAGYKPSDLLDGTKFVDMVPLGHGKTQDTFYEMKIPLAALGITRSIIETVGIGVMHISTFGQSGIGSIPYDPSVFDNYDLPYSADASSSGEKDDLDNFTSSMARIGKL